MFIVVLRPLYEGKARSIPVIPHEGQIDLELVEAGPNDGPDILKESGVAGVYVLGGGAASCESDDSPNGARCQSVALRWAAAHRAILSSSLEMDFPVLATGDGLFLLNEVFGGSAAQEMLQTSPDSESEEAKKVRRTIYVSPGSKTAAILGAGGFFRLSGAGPVPSLMDSQRAPRLLASAYAVDDGAVEGLESAEHDWVLGFRADLSGEEKLPRGFGGIFQGFVERAEAFLLACSVP